MCTNYTLLTSEFLDFEIGHGGYQNLKLYTDSERVNFPKWTNNFIPKMLWPKLKIIFLI